MRQESSICSPIGIAGYVANAPSTKDIFLRSPITAAALQALRLLASVDSRPSPSCGWQVRRWQAHDVRRKSSVARVPLAPRPLATVATCSYTCFVISTGIRELKNNLSRYVRQIEAGKRIAVTANGRVVAELGPPSGGAPARRGRGYDELVASGVVEPAVEPDSPLPAWPEIRTPSGTVAQLIDSDRGEA